MRVSVGEVSDMAGKPHRARLAKPALQAEEQIGPVAFEEHI
jgi:hypothetical protein